MGISIGMGCKQQGIMRTRGEGEKDRENYKEKEEQGRRRTRGEGEKDREDYKETEEQGRGREG